jgi:hypothetical protein
VQTVCEDYMHFAMIQGGAVPVYAANVQRKGRFSAIMKISRNEQANKSLSTIIIDTGQFALGLVRFG